MYKVEPVPFVLYFFIHLLCSFTVTDLWAQAVPNVTDADRCGEGIVNLTASGSTEIYAWYDAPTGGQLLDTGAVFTTPFLTSTTDFYASAFDTFTEDALDFDGIDDYVAINYSYATSGVYTDFAVEGWVNTTVSGAGVNDNWAIIDFDRSEYFNLYVTGDDGRVGFSTTDDLINTQDLYTPASATVNDGQWHHVAGVYDGTDKIIYIDGIEVARAPNAHLGRPVGTGTTRFGFIGDGSEANSFNGSRNNLYFQGQIDEVRVWSTARSADQINEFRYKCVSGESNLQLYYRMDDGSGSGTLSDRSGTGADGTLFNMNPAADWVGGPRVLGCSESSRVAATATVFPLPNPDLGPDQCVENSTTLDPGAGFSSYVWIDGSTGPTLNVTTSGLYWVEVSNADGCVNRDSIYVSVVFVPTTVDGSNCGTGTVDLSAAGSPKDQYFWYGASSGGEALAAGADFTTPEISSTTQYFVATYDTVTTTDGLFFDGGIPWVSIDNFFYQGSSYEEMTVETWVRTTNGGDQVIASYDRSEYWRLEINGDAGGTGQIGFGIRTSSGILDFGGNVRVDDGAWHHIAAVFDNGEVSIYVDGALDNQTTAGAVFGSGATRYGFLGVGSEADVFDGTTGPNNYLDGDLDEFRLWNVARTQAEIQTSMMSCLTGVEAGLEIYYKMSDGIGSGTLTDNSLNSNDGLLRNMNPNTVWIDTDNSIFGCAACESTRTAVTATILPVPSPDLGGNACAEDSYILDPGVGFSSYSWSDGSTDPTLTVNTGGLYWVDVTNVDGCINRDSINVGIFTTPTTTGSETCNPGTATLSASGSAKDFYRWYDAASGGTLLGLGSSFTTPILSSNSSYYAATYDTLPTATGLDFDGIDDYVALNNSYNTVGVYSEFTVEGWVNTSVSGAGVNDNWAIIDFDRSEYFNLYVTGDNGRVGFSSTDNLANIQDLYSPTTATVNDGQWHHVAGVYDGTDKIIYIDGLEVARAPNAHLGRPIGTGSTRFGFIGDGSEATSFDGARNENYFQGRLDEVRVWSVARTQLEIQQDLDNCLNGDEPGLDIYYQMDEGTGTFLTDRTATGNTGELFNMDPSTDWIDTDNFLFGCSLCESSRVEAVATVNEPPDALDVIVSCPGPAGSTVSLLASGGSDGTYDYREIGGAFNYDGTYGTVREFFSLSNGSTFDFEVMDNNGCTFTVNGINTDAAPVSIATATTMGSCISQGQGNWLWVSNGTDEAMVAVNDQGTALGEITVDTYVQASPGFVDGEAYMARHFRINSVNAIGGSGALFRLYFTGTELSDLQVAAAGTPTTNDDVSSIADVGTTRYEGPTEDDIFDESDATALEFLSQSSNGAELGANYIEILTASLSEFWLHASLASTPLPIELTYFRAEVRGEQVSINWATSSEVNTDYFVIEKSQDNKTYTEVGRVKAAGFSNEVIDYEVLDKNPWNGISYYRLKEIDLDGNTYHFPPVKIEYDGITQLSLYPNPIPKQTSLNISFNSKRDSQIKLMLIDAQGRSILSSTESVLRGINAIQLNPHFLRSGPYNLIIISGTQYYRMGVVVE